MNAISIAAQRFLPIVAVVLITVLAHRMVPSTVGILPRIFIITGIVVVALFLVSRGIMYWQSRQAATDPRR